MNRKDALEYWLLAVRGEKLTHDPAWEVLSSMLAELVPNEVTPGIARPATEKDTAGLIVPGDTGVAILHFTQGSGEIEVTGELLPVRDTPVSKVCFTERRGEVAARVRRWDFEWEPQRRTLTLEHRVLPKQKDRDPEQAVAEKLAGDAGWPLPRSGTVHLGA